MSANDSERHGHAQKKRTGPRDTATRDARSKNTTRHPVGPENVLRDGSGEPAVSGHNSSGASEKTRHALY